MLKELLESLLDDYEGDFVGYVAQDLLNSGYESDADLYKHMENISLYGGVSGTISSLTYPILNNFLVLSYIPV